MTWRSVAATKKREEENRRCTQMDANAEGNSYFPWVTLHASAKQSDDGSRTSLPNLVDDLRHSVSWSPAQDRGSFKSR